MSRSAGPLCNSFAGVWYGINPFDQPGVELGKRLTFAGMGRAGYSKEGPVAGDVGLPADIV